MPWARSSADRRRLATLGDRAVSHAARFGWGATTDRLLEVYRPAVADRTASPIDAGRRLVGVPSALVP